MVKTCENRRVTIRWLFFISSDVYKMDGANAKILDKQYFNVPFGVDIIYRKPALRTRKDIGQSDA